MHRSLRRAAAVSLVALGVVAVTAGPASAHPLGNFSVNTFSEVVVEPSAVRVSVVVDRAEIPTRQLFPTLDDRTGRLPGGADALASSQCVDVASAASLEVDGRAVPLSVTDASLDFPPGAAGLRTARLTCVLRTADLDVVGAGVDFALSRIAPADGWRETVALGDGVRLVDADVPTSSLSDALREYPEDRLASPLDVSSASFSVAAGSGAVTGVGALVAGVGDSVLPRGADRVTQAFTALVSRDRLTVPFGLFAVVVAMVLGGLHAFAPGHGKTVMAACLVGRRGTVRDAVLLGTAVTVTHTVGVLALGLVLTVLGLAQPERAYPLLAAASGLLLVGIGVVLLRSARRRRVVPVAAVLPAPERVLVGAGVAQGRGDRTHGDHAHADGTRDGHDHGHHAGHRHGAHDHGQAAQDDHAHGDPDHASTHPVHDHAHHHAHGDHAHAHSAHAHAHLSLIHI